MLRKVSSDEASTNRVSSCPSIGEDAPLKIAEIDRKREEYVWSTKDVMGFSTEGGLQTTYTDSSGNIRLIRQTFYGETFRSELAYYLINDKVFFITVDRLEYEKPIDIEPSPKVVRTLRRSFYLDDSEKVCQWYLEDVPQKNDDSTQEFVTYLLSILRIEKE